MSTPIALVTGCSRPNGLGFAVARGLAEVGFHPILTARDLSRAQSLADAIHDEGHDASALSLDLADARSIAAIGEHLRERFDRLDVLVNNASTVPDHDVLSPLDADLDEVRAALEVDVLGPWGLVQTLEHLLRQAPAARIVNVGSIAALQLTAGLDLGAVLRGPAHSVGKHLLLALTTTLSKAFSDGPILVNAVDPGEMATHAERDDEDDARPAADSAAWIVRAATLPPGSATGQLFRDAEIIPIITSTPSSGT